MRSRNWRRDGLQCLHDSAASCASDADGSEGEAQAESRDHDVSLTYVTARGGWYDVSWKGSLERSGGSGTNIGIHFFDSPAVVVRPADRVDVHLREPKRMAGHLG